MNFKVIFLILGENFLVGILDEEVKNVKRDFKNFDKIGQFLEMLYCERVNREKQIIVSKILIDQCIEKYGERVCNIVLDNYFSVMVFFYVLV